VERDRTEEIQRGAEGDQMLDQVGADEAAPTGEGDVAAV
jgi:hypothetical protein